ncbi:MAG TPA: trimeric intracellular cation channel family protein [Longimicrobiaceae bacterium]|nr:trimeric intracellular cation channel family protein [Longimicrobiaceae bacterium]
MIYALQLLGVAVFAASGALSAGRKRMDLMGVLVIAIVTALGGGTIRDVLLDRHPVFWIANPAFVVVSIAGAVATLLFARTRRPPVHSLAIADALGLGFFTIGGVQIALQAGVGGVVAVLMGTITGAAGGVIRDVLSAEIPLIFRKGHLYASTAIAGATLFLLLEAAGLAYPVPSLAGMVAIVGLRFASILRGWKLPVFEVYEERRGDEPRDGG